MSTLFRRSAVVMVAALAGPLWAAPAAWADTSTEPASVGAYFYSAGIDKPEQSPAAPRNVTAELADGVAPEHLAVAVQAPRQTDKMSFLSFDLAAVPFDATLTKAVVTVPLAENSPSTTDPRQANMQRSPAPNKVRACMAGDEGFNGEDGQSFASAPSVDCEAFSAAAAETPDKKAYSFDITALATKWLSEANTGMALVPAEGADSSPFQVVFLPFASSTLTAEYTVPTTETETEVVAPDVPTLPDAGTGFSGTTGSFDAALPETGGFGAVEAPTTLDTSLPAAEAPTAVAPEVAPTTRVRNVASSGEVPLTPSLSFWLGLALMGGLLLLLGLILGDSRVAAPAAASQSRLSRALQQRQRGDARRQSSGLGRPLSP